MAARKTASRVTASELASQDAGAADAAAAAAAAPAPKPVPPARAARPKQTPSRRRVDIAPMPQLGLQVRALDQTDYLPDPTRHMSEAGPVATSNFICRIGSRRVSVRMGAPRSTIPKEIQALMAQAGVTFGMAAPPAGKGAVVIEDALDDDDDGTPRARRTTRESRGPARRFRSPRALPME